MQEGDGFRFLLASLCDRRGERMLVPLNGCLVNAEEETMVRVGVVGVGNIGSIHAEVYRTTRAELTGA
jgi:hypothetical protein